MTTRTASAKTGKRPGYMRAHLALAALIVVAVMGLSLTSVGVFHVVAQTATTSAIVTQSSVAQVIGDVR